MSQPSADLWSLPHRLQSLVESEIEDGEQIVWLGQPIARRYTMKALPIVLFGIPWTAFAVFWMVGAAGFKIPNLQNGFDPAILFPLFGLPFVLIGVGMLGSPYWMARNARRTVYLLTDRRAIIFQGGFVTKIRSFAPAALLDISRNQRADGSGDVVFATDIRSSDNGRGTTDIGFLAIADVKRVQEMVRRLAESGRRETNQAWEE